LSWRGRAGFYDSYVNTNAHCPVCGEPVIFYQSAYGGRVFFDHPLGWPWPKHPCTDNSVSHGLPPKPVSKEPPQKEKGREWELTGWKPFVCLYQKTNEQGVTEIWGQVLTKQSKATNGFFVRGSINSLDLNLRDAPVFIKEIVIANGVYKLSTFTLDEETHLTKANVNPVNVFLSSARLIPTRRGIPLCPLCGTEARNLTLHVSRLHTRSTVRKPPPSSKKPQQRKPESADPSFVACPVCKVQVRPWRIGKHLLKVHKRNPTVYGNSLGLN
jgi:ssDNA-binding Zn-finger/Zn-ribbon topoisomerase 1